MARDHKAELANASAPAIELKPRLSVLIVSQVKLLSDSLAEALFRHESLVLSGCCSGLDEAEAKIRESLPDIVLLDAAFWDGFRFVNRIRCVTPQVRVVVLALAETAEIVVAWAAAGAAGYIPITAGLADVVPILLGIVRGEQRCSASLATELLRRLFSRDSLSAAPTDTLTARESEIVQLISAGLSNKEIARRLNIGVATTKSHVHHVLEKLSLQRRGQAALWMWVQKHQSRTDGGDTATPASETPPLLHPRMDISAPTAQAT